MMEHIQQNIQGSRCCSEFKVAEFAWYLEQSRNRVRLLVVSMHRHGKAVKKCISGGLAEFMVEY